ncbi:hypothetical protein PF327_05345 [Sulfurovum sp. XTW-4]|uniref:Uncharacterized protein n=1 Tax=Sulfurovum xiamenensis TaxID=3019066 RepID=A0ABT7QRA6_9BACT|nr:hypothetical protein [Sulfurovum xiamenensis]MDM5263618.1 hypothetical protein [Sulfurovum xiamenensis]
MRSDFEPVHLKEANAELDKILSDFKRPQEQEEEIVTKSLWKKFLDLFKRNPFELPDELSK